MLLSAQTEVSGNKIIHIFDWIISERKNIDMFGLTLINISSIYIYRN